MRNAYVLLRHLPLSHNRPLWSGNAPFDALNTAFSIMHAL